MRSEANVSDARQRLRRVRKKESTNIGTIKSPASNNHSPLPNLDALGRGSTDMSEEPITQNKAQLGRGPAEEAVQGTHS